MNVLITGGTGFIGSRLALRCVERGQHVRIFGQENNEAETFNKELITAKGVEFVSAITPCCSGEDSWGSIVAFYDPDGTVVELVEQPFMTFMSWLMRLFS